VAEEAVRAEAEGGAVETRCSAQAEPALLHGEVEGVAEDGDQAEQEGDVGKYTNYLFNFSFHLIFRH